MVIACDTRNNSTLFAKCAADVFTAEGIPVRLFSFPVPTPVLSFAVRELHTIAGINITASHNPKEYNGYKAYWEDGAQLPPEHADVVYAAINSLDIFADVGLIEISRQHKYMTLRVIPTEGKADLFQSRTMQQLMQATNQN